MEAGAPRSGNALPPFIPTAPCRGLGGTLVEGVDKPVVIVDWGGDIDTVVMLKVLERERPPSADGPADEEEEFGLLLEDGENGSGKEASC